MNREVDDGVELEEFSRSVGDAIRRSVDASVEPRDTELVARNAIAATLGRQTMSRLVMPLAAAAGLIAAVAFARPGGIETPTITATDGDARGTAAAQVPPGGSALVVLPPGGTDGGTLIETVDVGGVRYFVSVMRGLTPPSGLERIATVSARGTERGIFQLPGVSPRSALLMETVPGEGDSLGAFPRFLLLVGPDDPYTTVCGFIKASALPPQCK